MNKQRENRIGIKKKSRQEQKGEHKTESRKENMKEQEEQKIID